MHDDNEYRQIGMLRYFVDDEVIIMYTEHHQVGGIKLDNVAVE